MRQFFATRGLKHRPIQQIEGVESFSATLESGPGVSLVAELRSLARNRGMLSKALKETGPDLFEELHALWREGQTSQLVTNFIEVMLKVAPKGRVRA